MGIIQKIKIYLFGFFLVGLLLPAFTYNNILNFKKTVGKSEEIFPVLSLTSWFSGDFQGNVESYTKEMNGFSNFFIRTFNQIDFSLFREVHMLDGLLGKEDYLYQRNYLLAYYGQDLVAEERIDSQLIKMKFVQDTLSKLNKEFFYVLCPGKGSFYPEYLPENKENIKPGTTNYELISQKMRELGINHIDFDDYFNKRKNTTKYPIFTKTGVHWSMYAQTLVMDSLNRLIEQKTHKNIPDVTWTSIKMDLPNYWDADVENYMNLHFRIKSPLCAYPNKKIEVKEGDELLKVLVISDSYLGGLVWDGWLKSFDKTSQFRFYNSEVTISEESKLNAFQYPLMEQLKDKEVIIFGSTDGGYKYLNWWAIDIMYEHFRYNRNTKYENYFLSEAEKTKKELLKDKELLKKLLMKSKETSLSVDSLLTIKSYELTQEKIKFDGDITKTLR